MENLTVFGSAGTGKTTFGIEYVTTLLESSRAAPEEIAYLAFTRAASRDAVERISASLLDKELEIDDRRFQWFRTLHSLCYRLQAESMGDGNSGRLGVVTTAEMKNFARTTGMSGEYAIYRWEDLAEAFSVARGSIWDTCQRAFCLSRLLCRGEDELDAVRVRPHPEAVMRFGAISDQYQAFVAAYERFKEQEGLIDFVDMLEWTFRHGKLPKSIRFVVWDEAQDATPLMWSVLDRLTSQKDDLEMFLKLGDDWQCIFQFAGARAEDFLSQSKRGKRIHLTYTHRFGPRLVAFSNEIVRRIRVREHREIVSAIRNRDSRIQATGQFKPFTGPGLVLHRHTAGCREIGNQFRAAGLPFRNERGADPLGASSRVAAFLALHALSRGESVATHEVAAAIDDLVPSVAGTDEDGDENANANAGGLRRIRLVAHGAKAKLREHKQGADGTPLAPTVTLDTLAQVGTLSAEAVRLIRARNWNLFRFHEDLDYYSRVLENGYSLDRDSNVPVVTTIHGAKGRQAPRVLVFSETGRRCWNDPDGEHRVAYVAATRAEESLEICTRPLLDRTIPYDYPLPAEKTALVEDERLC